MILCSTGATAALLALPTPLAEIHQEVPQHFQSVQVEPERSQSQPKPAPRHAPRAVNKPDEKSNNVALQPDSSIPLNLPSLLEPMRVEESSHDALPETAAPPPAIKEQMRPSAPSPEPSASEQTVAPTKDFPAIGAPSRLTPPVEAQSSKEQPAEQNLLVLPLIEYGDKPAPKSGEAPEQVAQEPSSPPAEEEAPTQPQPIIGKANRVTVPSIQIDMPVKTGTYDTTTHTWQVDESSAFHADTTVPVNDTNGTTLIYGHAKWGIFGNLPDVSDGAEAIVYTDEGQRFIYTFESVQQVDPADVSVLRVDGAPKLVLQTCSGWFDEHRTLAVFTLKEILSAEE